MAVYEVVWWNRIEDTPVIDLIVVVRRLLFFFPLMEVSGSLLFFETQNLKRSNATSLNARPAQHYFTGRREAETSRCTSLLCDTRLNFIEINQDSRRISPKRAPRMLNTSYKRSSDLSRLLCSLFLSQFPSLCHYIRLCLFIFALSVHLLLRTQISDPPLSSVLLFSADFVASLPRVLLSSSLWRWGCD